MKGTKPRLPSDVKTNGTPANKAEVQRLSREYLEVRNQQMRAKAFLAEMAAAVRRGELIDKRLVAAQAQYLVRCDSAETLEPAANLFAPAGRLE